ncbi:unnamed protein product [Effrenium voratum]|nr:unnamed protein product [Effrenium voratum]
MALDAVRQPGTDKSLTVQQGFTREGLSYELTSKTDEQKAVAISDLAAKGESFVANHLDHLVAELHRSHSPEVKQAVCKAIMAAGSSAAPFYQDLAGLTHDSNPEVRYWGCLAVGSMGSAASGSKGRMCSLLQDPSEAVRFGACSALGGIKADDCTEDLKQMLTDASPEVQGAACLALAKVGADSCAPTVAQKLAQPRARSNALKALGLMGREGGACCADVVECLCDDDAETRVLAAAIVGKMSEYVRNAPAIVNRILELVRDEDGRRRIAALLALGYMGYEASAHKDIIQDALMDDFEEDADNALTQGGCRSRLPPSCRKAKCAAAAALSRIAAVDKGFGWESAAAQVARLLDEDDWEVKTCALECLAQLGGRAREHVDKIFGQLGDERYIVRAKAAAALGSIGEVESISLNKLADLLEDKCPAVKSAAALGLAQLGDEGAEHSHKVFNLLTDISADVRAAAVRALANMRDRGPYFATVIAQRLQAEGEDPKVRIAAMEALAALEAMTLAACGCT